jgi:hypothetical protein
MTGTASGLSTATPIRYVINIIRENRTYDNYYGRLPIPGADRMELPDASMQYSDPMSPTHGTASFAARDYMAVREQFSEKDVHLMWEWAREYGAHDRFFSEQGGPSTPGHLWLVTGNNGHLLNNNYGKPLSVPVRALRRFNQPGLPDQPVPPFAFPTVPGLLTRHGIAWRNYGGSFFNNLAETRNSPNTFPTNQFFSDALAGELPTVCWLYSPEFSLNEHAPDNVTAGIGFTAAAIGAVMLSGIPWEQVAINVFYDDSGGFWDHVTPPDVERYPGAPWIHWRHGYRLPALTISAWSRQGANHTMLSQCSAARMILDLIGEKPFQDRTITLASGKKVSGHDLGYRDGEVNSLLSAFDFTQKPLPPPITTEGRLMRTLDRPLGQPGEPVKAEWGLTHAQRGKALAPPTADDLALMRKRAEYFRDLKTPVVNGLNF